MKSSAATGNAHAVVGARFSITAAALTGGASVGAFIARGAAKAAVVDVRSDVAAAVAAADLAFGADGAPRRRRAFALAALGADVSAIPDAGAAGAARGDLVDATIAVVVEAVAHLFSARIHFGPVVVTVAGAEVVTFPACVDAVIVGIAAGRIASIAVLVDSVPADFDARHALAGIHARNIGAAGVRSGNIAAAVFGGT